MLVEAVELSDRPFYVGVQYHPEFKSRPNRPHPLFQGFLAAALERQKMTDLDETKIDHDSADLVEVQPPF